MEKIKRIHFYDNLKFILMILVVFGHFIQFNLNGSAEKGVFLFIYSFHMPLFVFLTGLFSKNVINGDAKKRLNKIISYLIFYLIYKVLLYVVLVLILKQPYYISPFSEMEIPWYLLAVILWIIITSILKDIKPKYLMIFSVCCCLLVGYDSSISDQLCLSRVFNFFPFFLAGYLLSFDNMKKVIDFLHSSKWKAFLSLVLLLIIGSLFIYFGDSLYFLRPLFTARNSYSLLNIPFDFPFLAIIMRFIWLLYNLLIAILIFTIIPNKKTFYTKYGSFTLQVFFLHFFIAAIVGCSFISDSIYSIFGDFSILIFLLLSVIVTLFLSSKIFSKIFTKIMSYDYKFIYK